MLTLSLTRIAKVSGIYTVGGVPNQLPERMRYLHPTAAQMFRAIEDWVVVSDMFRSPESSLAAKRGGRGAMPPGYSAHNYGLAIDIAIGASMLRLGRHIGRSIITKADLDDAMRSAGWFCHLLEPHNAGESEAWHYNALGIHAQPKGKRSSDEVEGRILDLYGAHFDPGLDECQAALRFLRMYRGEVDGIAGPLTKEATMVFQRAWGLPETGDLDRKTKRTLVYVSCGRTVSAP